MKRLIVPPLVLLGLSLCLSAGAVEMRDITYVTKDAGRVLFSHTSHMRQKGMAGNCKACHDGIFNIRKKSHATMADMARGRSCGACHNGRKAFGLDDCSACHPVKDVVFRVAQTGPTRFSHRVHVRKYGCAGCHPALYRTTTGNRHVTMAAMKKGASCGACHNGKAAFALAQCDKCHPTRDVTFSVKGIDNVKFSHVRHTDQYTCKDCHARLFAAARSSRPVSMGAMNKGASCGACHDGTKAFSVRGNCDSCHAS